MSISSFTVTLLFRGILSILFLVLGIVLLIRYNKAGKSARSAVICNAQVADLRTVQQFGTNLFSTELALLYTGSDGCTHRAFISVPAPAPLNTQIGAVLPIAVFADQLTQAAPQAYDPTRGADGRLPDRVYPVQVSGIPLDETATVMLSADYTRFQAQTNRSSRSLFIVGICLTVFGVMRLLAFIPSLLSILRYL